MDFKGLYGKAKSGFKDLGEGDKDLLETMESDDDMGAMKSEDESDKYERGEDMLADLERDIEISRNRRQGKMGDDMDSMLDDLEDF